MLETSSKQINDQNHDHNHDHITSKRQKNIKWRNWRISLFLQSGKKWSNFLFFSTYLNSFPPSRKYFIIAICFHEVQKN